MVNDFQKIANLLFLGRHVSQGWYFWNFIISIINCKALLNYSYFIPCIRLNGLLQLRALQPWCYATPSTLAIITRWYCKYYAGQRIWHGCSCVDGAVITCPSQHWASPVVPQQWRWLGQFLFGTKPETEHRDWPLHYNQARNLASYYFYNSLLCYRLRFFFSGVTVYWQL